MKMTTKNTTWLPWICAALGFMLQSLLFGQTEIKHENVVIGTNLTENAPLWVDAYVIEDSIIDFNIDERNLAKILSRPQSSPTSDVNTYERISFLDVSQDSILWNRTYDFRHTIFIQKDSILLESIAKRTTRIDPRNGNRLWSVVGANFGIESNQGLAYMYQFNKRNTITENLMGVNLLNGKSMWEKEVSNKYGWNSSHLINDSTALILSDGLHTINLSSGIGWSMEGKTGVVNTTDKGAIATVSASAFLFGLTGAFIAASFYQTNPVVMRPTYLKNYYGLTRDLCSNALVRNDAVYYSDSRYLYKLDISTGEKIWRGFYYTMNVGQSQLMMRDSNLVVVNLGSAQLMDKTIDYKIPFVASFDSDTGQRLFLHSFKESKKPVLDYKILPSHILVLFRTHLVKINLDNGKVEGELYFEHPLKTYNGDYNERANLVDEDYLIQQGLFKTYDQIPSNLVIIDSEIAGPILVDISSMSLQPVEPELTIFKKLELGELTIAQNEDRQFILDRKYEAIGKIEFTSDWQVLNNRYYTAKGNKLYSFTLDDFELSTEP